MTPSTDDDHRARREQIGAYVLGQLEPGEEAAVREHLSSCPSCRDEARALAPLAGILRTADADRIAPVPEPPAELGDRVVRELQRAEILDRRRRLIRRVAAAVTLAASVAVAFALGTFARPAGPVLPPGQPLAVTVAGGVSAQAELVRHTWGTEIRLQASGLRQGDPYAVRLVTDSGSEVSAGSIIGTGTNPLTCSLNAAVPFDQASRVFVADRSGTVVVNGEIG